MPSPFPGMDPYLEDPGGWLGIHNPLIAYLCEDLNERLGSRYIARCDERLLVESTEGRRRGIYPDVVLVEKPVGRAKTEQSASPAGTALVSEPIRIRIATAAFREARVEIRDRKGGHVVTAIEILSPSNKTHGESGRDLYLKKQKEVLASTASLVEIDLLRAGEWALALPKSGAGAAGEFDYLVSISRASDREVFDAWPIRISQRLPIVGIPLSAGDPDISADLQSLLDRVYDRGRYAETIDYQDEPGLPLRPADASWADGLLRAAGLRR